MSSALRLFPRMSPSLMYPPTSTSEDTSRSLLAFSLISICDMFPRRETAARRRGVVYMNLEGSVWMNRLVPLRGYPAPMEGASPAWRRGHAWPSLQVMGVGRLVRLGMVLPFTSVVTVVSNVVSRVLSKKKMKRLLDSGSLRPKCKMTRKARVEWRWLEAHHFSKCERCTGSFYDPNRLCRRQNVGSHIYSKWLLSKERLLVHFSIVSLLKSKMQNFTHLKILRPMQEFCCRHACMDPWQPPSSSLMRNICCWLANSV